MTASRCSGLVYFGLKTALVYFGVIWIRGTLPRLRIDQVNAVNWKFLVPLALAVVAVTAIADKLAALAGLELHRHDGDGERRPGAGDGDPASFYARSVRRREAAGLRAAHPARA